MQDITSLSIVNSFHILHKNASERKLVKWVQVGISRSFFSANMKKTLTMKVPLYFRHRRHVVPTCL